MTASSYLLRARRSAEALMQSRCRITRVEPVSLDTSTLNLTDTNPDDDLVWEGPCRLRSNTSTVLTTDAEGQLVTEQQLILSLPIAASGIKVRDEVEITDGGPDPQLVGATFRVLGIPAVTLATARRFPVEQTTTS